MSLGRAIWVVRRARGWTQADLADVVRCENSFISLIEAGKRKPSLSTLGSIAKALSIRLHDLVALGEQCPDAIRRMSGELISDMLSGDSDDR